LRIVEGKELTAAYDIENMTKTISRRLFTPDFLWDWVGIGTESPSVKAMRERFQNFLLPLIDERKKYWKENEAELNAILSGSVTQAKNWNVLDRLLYSYSTSSDGKTEGFTPKEIVDEIVGFFGAGFETTNNTITWILYQLCQRPEIVKKIRKEVLTICSQKDGKWDIISHLNDLKYLTNVIKETQRLHPVVITLRKDSVKPAVVMGDHFEANSAFQVNIIAIHRNPKHWKNPLEFNPDRFDEEGQGDNSVLIPFGDGPMKCIGFRMAMIEIKVIIAHLVMAFDFGYVDQKFEAITSVTYGLKNGLKVRLLPIQ
jgi:cytochrome P450